MRQDNEPGNDFEAGGVNVRLLYRFRKLTLGICLAVLLVNPDAQAGDTWYLQGQDAPGLPCRPVAESYGLLGPSAAPHPIRTPDDVAQVFRSAGATVLPVPTYDPGKMTAFHVFMFGHEIGLLMFFRDQRLCLSILSNR
jgi:hypothetical protein